MKRLLAKWAATGFFGTAVLLVLLPFLLVAGGGGVLLAKYTGAHPEARPVVEAVVGLFYLAMGAQFYWGPPASRKPEDTRLRQTLAALGFAFMGLSRFLPSGPSKTCLVCASLACWAVHFLRRPRRFFVAPSP